MAQLTYSVTTSATGVNKVWRKVQGEVAQGFGFEVDEWNLMEDLKDYRIDVSAREITVPLDINEGAGIASIDEGSVEANPFTPNMEELTLNYVLFNGRFTASVTAELLDTYQRAAELKRQLVYQSMKKIQDLARHWGDYFYGLSTGVLCQTSTVATQSSGTYTLLNGYGQTTITNAALIADKFKVSDRVALIRAGALVTNAIGTVTAVTPATPSIAVTWNGSVTSANLDNVVKANSIENTTIAGTDFNRGMTGLLDLSLTASVHGLSSASVGNWSVAVADTTAGRWSGVKFHKGMQEIMFQGGAKADTCIIAPGVYRDVLALQQGALRFSDPFALELDGTIKGQGVKFFQSKRVPSSWVWMFAKDNVRKLNVMPRPDNQITWGDGIRMENTSGYIFPVSLLTQLVTNNRKAIAYWNGQTEQ